MSRPFATWETRASSSSLCATRSQAAKALGPRLILAGLVDGGGPNAFGTVAATTPEEGRAVVRRYHDAGFHQVKLYSLLDPDVVAAIASRRIDWGR